MKNLSVTKWTLTLSTIAVLATSGSLYAADKKSKKDMAADQAQMQAMMAKAAQNGAPNANHQVFAPLVGKWTYTSKFWMKPGDKAMESTGTSTHELILGNRFLKQTVAGNMNGQAFEGLGYLGYDNVKGEYQSTWMDNMMTGIMKMAGPYDPATKTIKNEGTMSCPMTGQKDMFVRSEWILTDNNNSTYNSYSKDEKGTEYKTMELTYKRAQ